MPTRSTTWPPLSARLSFATGRWRACAPISTAPRTSSTPLPGIKARLLLAASTSEIYGKNPKPGLCEDDDRIIGSPLKSRWSYAEAKAIDESLIDAYCRERGLRAVIIRFFNTVGPRQTGRYGMVIPRLIRQALDGETLTVYGTGEQIRCFCHVLDVIPALAQLMATPGRLRPGRQSRQ